VHTCKDILIFLLPWAPFVHLFGFLPQVNTFIMYFIEQLNIHLFGGSGIKNIAAYTYGEGTPNLPATIFDFTRSLIIFGILYGVGWASQLHSQFLFALFIGLIVGLSFLHSRLVTDPLLFTHFLQGKPKL